MKSAHPRIWIGCLFVGFLLLLPVRMPTSTFATSVTAQAADCLQLADSALTVPANQTNKDCDLVMIDGLMQDATESIGWSSLALHHTADPEIRRLALKIAESLAGEMQLLRNWRSMWYSNAPALLPSNTPDSIPMFADSPDDSDENQATPQPYSDENYLAAILTLQKDTRDMLSLAAIQATHPELRAYASTSIETRSVTIRSIESLVGAPEHQPES